MRYIVIGIVGLAVLSVVGQFLANGFNGLYEMSGWIWVLVNPFTLAGAWAAINSIAEESDQKHKDKISKIKQDRQKSEEMEDMIKKYESQMDQDFADRYDPR